MPDVNRLSRLIKYVNPFALLILISSEVLRYVVPPFIIFLSPNDDQLGVIQAHSILTGDWLGKANELTFSKPPGYAIFLVLCHYLHLPVIPTVHFLYLLAGLYFALILRRYLLMKKRYQNAIYLLLFALIAFNPLEFSLPFSRVYRSNLNSALVLLFVALLIHLLLYIDSLNEREILINGLRGQFWRIIFPVGIGLGLTYSGLVLTRVESFWIGYPAILIVFLKLCRLWWTKRKKSLERDRVGLHYLSLVVLIAICSYFLPMSFVTQQNSNKYQVPIIEDFFSGPFADTVKLWSSVIAKRDSRLPVYVSHAQRMAVYAVSPSAKLLEPILDSPNYPNARKMSCTSVKICDEETQWFVWSLRAAPIYAQLVRNTKEWRSYFEVLSGEIRNACKSHALKCGPTPLSVGTRPLSDYPKSLLIKSAFNEFTALFDYSSFGGVAMKGNLGNRLSTTTPELFNLWRSTVSFTTIPEKQKLPKKTWINFLFKQIIKPMMIAVSWICLGFFLLLLLWPRISHVKIWRNEFVWFSLLSMGAATFGLGLSDIMFGTTSHPGGLYSLPVANLYLSFIIFLCALFSQTSIVHGRSNDEGSKSESGSTL